MIPKSGYRFPACAKPSNHVFIRPDASAGEGRSETIMLEQLAPVSSAHGRGVK
jgi:hypothetical protein